MKGKYRIPVIALTLGLAMPITLAQQVDKILLNGQIYTAVERQPLQEAIAIYQDTIVKVGTNQEILALADKNTIVMDLHNQVVLPGLIDSHLHPLMGGLESVTANMNDEYLDIKTLADQIKAFQLDGTAKAGDMLVVNGISAEQWLHLDDLNQTFNTDMWANIPIALVGSDHHTSWANKALLKKANVNAKYIQSLSPAEQHNIGHDDQFEPNGFLVDSGWDYVSEVIPELDEQLIYQGGVAGIKLLNSYGITGWLDVATNASPNKGLFNIKNTDKTVGMLPLYQKLSENNDLTVHAAGLQVINSKSNAKVLDIIENINQQYRGINNLRLMGVKVFADGVIEFPAQSSALMGGYKNSGKKGELLFDPKVFSEVVDVADQKGMIVHVHAIGDRAVNESLNAFEQARKNRSSGLPHTITHLQLVAPNDYDRFKALNVIASMQFLWAYPDDYIEQMVKPYISAENYLGMYPAKSLLKHGATLAGASDFPVSSANPFAAMSIAITRSTGNGKFLNKEEAIELTDLLQAYTINAAKALQWENEIGSLEAGKKADLILLDRDIFKITPEKLAETKVIWTMFEGKLIFQAPASQ